MAEARRLTTERSKGMPLVALLPVKSMERIHLVEQRYKKYLNKL